MNDLTYRRQYVIGTSRPPTVDWQTLAVGPAVLAAHPDLKVHVSHRDGVSVACLGPIVDTDNPANGSEAVVSALATKIRTFRDFELATTALAGRWAMLVCIGDVVRLYPDAAGTRAAFYLYDDATGATWAASLPPLLPGARLDHELERRFLRAAHGNSWPGEVTPYAGVRQLLPNHYLDLNDGKSQRFGPIAPSVQISLREAAETMHAVLRAQIDAFAARGRIVVPLTGGYDSRTLFAAAGTRRVDARFFTVVDPDTPRYDVSIPRKLARRFAVDVARLQAEPISAEWWSVHKKNTANMLWDPGEIKLATFHRHFEQSFVLTGGVAELCRCFYYEDGIHGGPFTAGQIAALTGYEDNEVAISAFGHWLADAADVEGVATLDLLYWEHRVGNWLAITGNALDTACEAIPLFNCRKLIDAGLALDAAQRKEPYALFRAVCELGAPGSLRIPFNRSASETLLEVLERFVPWRVRAGWRNWRMRRAGLAH